MTQTTAGVMAGLFAFIATFLGSSTFWIAGGVPFLPLQTLWVNFTVTVFQAVGLGYGTPADGLMERTPRPADQPILSRKLLLWLAFNGLIMGVITLAVIWWGTDQFGDKYGRTMGLTVFSILNVAFSLGDQG